MTSPKQIAANRRNALHSTGPRTPEGKAVVSQNPAIATASVTGTDITITGVATGSTTIQVKATDLDGNSVTQNIPVTVP